MNGRESNTSPASREDFRTYRTTTRLVSDTIADTAHLSLRLAERLLRNGTVDVLPSGAFAVRLELEEADLPAFQNAIQLRVDLGETIDDRFRVDTHDASRDKVDAEHWLTSGFIDRCVRPGSDDSFVLASEFYAAYQRFCDDVKQRPISGTKFGTIMGKKYRRIDDRLRKYVGIRLVDVPAPSLNPQYPDVYGGGDGPGTDVAGPGDDNIEEAAWQAVDALTRVNVDVEPDAGADRREPQPPEPFETFTTLGAATGPVLLRMVFNRMRGADFAEAANGRTFQMSRLIVAALTRTAPESFRDISNFVRDQDASATDEEIENAAMRTMGIGAVR